MKLSIIDGSNYFKGLLLLIRKDRKIVPAEIILMKRIGKTLGFEAEFCDNAIQEILDNRFIVDAPPEFSTEDLAVKFIKDGLALAHSDGEIHPEEEEWLRSVAEKNGIDPEVFSREREAAAMGTKFPGRLEVDDMTVVYS